MGKPSGAPADVGLIGLAVMGSNLALNMADHGFRVAVFNRDIRVMRRFVDQHPHTPGGLVGCRSLRALVSALKRPRRIVMMIKSGAPVDSVTAKLVPLLDRGDVIIDGGNRRFAGTVRRERELAGRGRHFVGSGVSGGEEGARFGPSLMPGGSREAWRSIKPIWTAIAARVDRRTGRQIEGAEPGRPVRGGDPCAAHIGADGAGHYVKMVHNGIEYGDMQLIAEAWFLLTKLLGLKPDELSEIFATWNRGVLDSFLIEVTAEVLKQRDPVHPRRFLVDSVLDAAGQKGTGKWTGVEALDLGVPAPTIVEAVFARAISALKEQRVAAGRRLRGPRFAYRGGKHALIDAVRDALYLSKICSYAQGFALMDEARRKHGWKLDFKTIARIWRGGCIIRARLLQKIAEAYDRQRRLPNLMVDPYFARRLTTGQTAWRKVVGLAAAAGIPCPAFMSSLAYYDGYRSGRLPASLLQLQRDFFGAHGFERIDRPRGRSFHIDWPDPERPLVRR
jgi:6-phosphogluconate dehydrogenase